MSARGAWQNVFYLIPELPMQPNPVNWFEIYVQDMPRARRFYETVFQCRLEPRPMPEGVRGMEMLPFPARMSAAGAAGALVRMSGVASGGGGTLIYFACDDCAVELSRVVAAGGTVFRPKFSIGPNDWLAFATDTEGNLIGLRSTH
jgi:predicted enzyme related to lactoylglutathione lyase